MRDADLELFVRESNRIEGILSNPHESDDFHAHEVFLGIATPSVADLVNFVGAIRGGPLRNRPGMDVRVGRHLPPRGGPDVERHLMALLKWAADNEVSPWNLHVEYETLHPFMDGNGRSGRALWAWQILRHGLWPNTLAMGFLHPAYYAALDAQGKRA